MTVGVKPFTRKRPFPPVKPFESGHISAWNHSLLWNVFAWKLVLLRPTGPGERLGAPLGCPTVQRTGILLPRPSVWSFLRCSRRSGYWVQVTKQRASERIPCDVLEKTPRSSPFGAQKRGRGYPTASRTSRRAESIDANVIAALPTSIHRRQPRPLTWLVIFSRSLKEGHAGSHEVKGEPLLLYSVERRLHQVEQLFVGSNPVKHS